MASKNRQRRLKHLGREKADWHKFQRAFEAAWVEHLQKAGVISSENDWESWIKDLQIFDFFLVEHFKQYEGTDPLDNPLGQANSLVLWARRRLRAKFHVFITCKRNFGFSAKKYNMPATMYSDHPYLTKDVLLDAVRMACGIDYVLTLSAPRAGPSVHGMHFQAMPKRLLFKNQHHQILFSWLDANISPVYKNSTQILKDYPAVCVRISGEQNYVTESTWHLASNYNRLMSYNIIILGINQEKVKVFFFPRPFLPHFEGPKDFSDIGWSFGGFEMGGFFLVGDERAFKRIIAGGKNILSEYLREVSVSSNSQEMEKFQKLLKEIET